MDDVLQQKYSRVVPHRVYFILREGRETSLVRGCRVSTTTLNFDTTPSFSSKSTMLFVGCGKKLFFTERADFALFFKIQIIICNTLSLARYHNLMKVALCIRSVDDSAW
eukprot:scaffold2667_cov218-Chaetoceros_neogracile.AAC.2